MRPATYQDWKEINSQFRPKSDVVFTMLYNANEITIDFSVAYKRGLGGLGITRRPFEEIEHALPGITNRYKQEHGKIGILGNGFSEAALDLASLHRNGFVKDAPVVVDIFSYTMAHGDLIRLARMFEERDLWFPCHTELETVGMIDKATQQENLRTISYFVGSGSIPCALNNFDLLINSHGPPLSTLDEQVSMLAAGGELYVNLQPYHRDPAPKTCTSYDVTDNTKGLHAVGFRSYIIRRIS